MDVIGARAAAPAAPPAAPILPSPEEIRRWLAEDVGSGDVTSRAVVPDDAVAVAQLLLKEAGVVCGLDAVRAVFEALDPEIAWNPACRDGERREPGPVATVRGRARAILAGERVALNLFGRLCGVATLAREFVDAVEGTGAAILDTRKTTPGLRRLEKAAVRCGGATNHRQGLFDAVLIKDNHLRFGGGIGPAVAAARRTGLPVEVECDTLDQVREAVQAGADEILLDNMPPAVMREAVGLVAGRARLEASGGVTLDTVRAIAETGVDLISVGALTHSARALNVSLEVLS
jgi:nicotinate-nucleotide pyrophosphorylase (carboxylating)